MGRDVSSSVNWSPDYSVRWGAIRVADSILRGRPGESEVLLHPLAISFAFQPPISPFFHVFVAAFRLRLRPQEEADIPLEGAHVATTRAFTKKSLPGWTLSFSVGVESVARTEEDVESGPAEFG